ncbi:hypothetical protein KCP75_20275 [Salmonella enterica subsp. enterica]|nr:hypothetical protein KCP75_20275 [Salmonella enterica subsp. enterica]
MFNRGFLLRVLLQGRGQGRFYPVMKEQSKSAAGFQLHLAQAKARQFLFGNATDAASAG